MVNREAYIVSRGKWTVEENLKKFFKFFLNRFLEEN